MRCRRCVCVMPSPSSPVIAINLIPLEPDSQMPSLPPMVVQRPKASARPRPTRRRRQDRPEPVIRTSPTCAALTHPIREDLDSMAAHLDWLGKRAQDAADLARILRSCMVEGEGPRAPRRVWRSWYKAVQDINDIGTIVGDLIGDVARGREPFARVMGWTPLWDGWAE